MVSNFAQQQKTPKKKTTLLIICVVLCHFYTAHMKMEPYMQDAGKVVKKNTFADPLSGIAPFTSLRKLFVKLHHGRQMAKNQCFECGTLLLVGQRYSNSYSAAMAVQHRVVQFGYRTTRSHVRSAKDTKHLCCILWVSHIQVSHNQAF